VASGFGTGAAILRSSDGWKCPELTIDWFIIGLT
jgi:hypothetical protein